jgi:hypothetical protein
VELVVERLAPAEIDEAQLVEEIRSVVGARILSAMQGVVPFVDVTVLPAAR